MLVVNAEKILKSDERDVEEMAKVLRARLDEAIQRLKVRFPVYLIFTHADAIEGFRDSFSTSKNEDKTLVWGSTIPLEKSDNAQALFDGEYEVLQNSVMKRRTRPAFGPVPAGPAASDIQFSAAFRLRPAVNSERSSTRFSARTRSAKTRSFVAFISPPHRPRKPRRTLRRPLGRVYFTERFFRDVVLRDKDLVQTFQAQRQRAPIFGWLMTMLGAMVVLGCSV